ncbi:MAG: hypothetical protein HY895_20040 [Deltaproteobacteria bacterium]|nr:hypothetical protein [Deltaproteobacteria bacterium]
MRSKLLIGLAMLICILTGLPSAAQETSTSEPPQDEETVRTPPRLSFVDGQVSFWRPGAQDWVQAQLNTAIAPGDQLFTGSPGNLELQIGPRACVRGWADTQIGLENLEPDFLQFKVTAGHASFDLRTLEPGHTVEVDTPNAAFTIDHAGYYRVDVNGERTSFITRRAGRATVTPANGEAFSIAPSEEVVIEGVESPKISSYAAPQLDSWDRWNYARTDSLLDAVSARYVSPGIYGVSDLDRNGTWRTVPEYGPVWVPTGVPAGWAPYSTGSWIHDPYYGWTWVDTAPWGWAPYHYGRWAHFNGYWGWVPGPAVVRPVYAPALVAFFGHGNVSVGVSIGGPAVGWVALGWGEPCVPWWGRPGFAHRPWWGGWGGPRVVNNVVVHHTTVVNVENINVYRNAGVRNGIVVVKQDRFGHGPITSARIAHVEAHDFRPTHAAPKVATGPASFAPSTSRGVRPPEASLKRPVVATRAPHAERGPGAGKEPNQGPAPRLVSPPQSREAAATLPRPAFGQSKVERSTADRVKTPAPPKPGLSARPARGPEEAPPANRPAQRQQPEQAAGAPPASAKPELSTRPARGPEAAPPVNRPVQRQRPEQAAGTPPASQQPPPQRLEAPRGTSQNPMPGEPASRLSPHRGEAKSPGTSERKPPAAGPVQPTPQKDRGNGQQNKNDN